MEITADNKFKKLIVVGDRVLIKPKKDQDRTKSGLYLPSGVKEKEQVQSGYIMKAGPGYPIPIPVDEDESWKDKDDQRPLGVTRPASDGCVVRQSRKRDASRRRG